MDETLSEIKERLAAEGITSFRSLLIGNKTIWTIFFLLIGISLVAVYSSSSMVIFKNGGNNSFSVLLKQTMYLFAGVVITIIVSQFVYRLKPGILKKQAFFWYLVSIVLLLMTFFSAFSEEVNGAHRWINIFGFSIQPSEFAKMALVIYIAKICSENQQNIGDPKKVLYKILIATGIIACIVLVSNFSTALFIVVIMFFMMYLGRIPFTQLMGIGAVGVGLAVVMGFIIIKQPQIFPRGETWQKRVVSFVPSLAPYASGYNPDTDYAPIDNYQVTQAKIAIAEGGVLGKMPGNSTQRYKLSQAYCDCIYAIIIEEMGWAGAIILVLAYFWLIWQSLNVAKKMQHVFDELVVLGLMFMMVAQAFLHMGVVVNLLPATGQTLPVVSSGGSSLFITCMEFGIVLGMSQYAESLTDTPKKSTSVEKNND